MQCLDQIDDVPKNSLLVSFDAVGLYLLIPHDQGAEIIQRFLDKREDQSVSSEHLCELANIVLKQTTLNWEKMFTIKC